MYTDKTINILYFKDMWWIILAIKYNTHLISKEQLIYSTRDPTKWQLLIICQAFESVSQDTATCTATLQDQDETSISSIDGMEHGGVHIIQQTLHSDEGKEHGVQNKDSLMNTGNGLVK